MFHVVLMIQSAPCSKTISQTVTPRQVVEKVSRTGWLLIKQDPWGRLQQSLNRQRRSLNQVRSQFCNWTTETDDNVDRNPRHLSKAVCNGCSWYCKPVNFHLRVLVKDCTDLKTHHETMTVWKWETVSLPVAFVYSP